ncbi:MAG: hypothetical protein LBG60_01510 [Bifidobacteriaceae bacterium]|jgi:hypothetical protein|nr:hypothetical protein [Bifidobacteriaceae bacterium]
MASANGARRAGHGAGLASELRNWAEGTARARAAVELLLAGVGGRLAYRGAPWVERLGVGADGRAYARIDPAKLAAGSGPLSSGERLVAKVVANLLDDQTFVPLADLSRLDFGQARLVLGALRTAAGLPAPATARPAAALPPPAPRAGRPGAGIGM